MSSTEVVAATATTPTARRGRWRRLLVRALILAAVFILGMNTHVYWGLNAGIMVGTDGHNIGLEVKGAPGFFFNQSDKP